MCRVARNRYGRDMPIWGTEAGWSDGLETALEGKQDFGRLTSLAFELNVRDLD